MAEDLIPHSETKEGATIVAVTPKTINNNHTSAPKANTNFVTPVTNGNTETKKQNFPDTVTGPIEVNSGEKLEYIISTYIENNKDTLDKDKERMRWCFYIDGVTLGGSKKHIQIKNSDNQKEDTGDNFLIIEDVTKKTIAIENDSYLYAKAEVVEIDGEKKNKLTIVFSKWLDSKKVHIEAYRNRPDHKPSKDYVVTSTVTAKPEVVDIKWVNAQEVPIKFAGYDQDVFLQLETLGLDGRELNIDIIDYDKDGDDDTLDWGANSIKITGRKTLKQFPVKKRTEYGLQEKDEITAGLDLYAKINSSDSLENLREKYATYLDLTPNEKVIEAYFAEERKKEVQKGEDPSKEEPKQQVVEKPAEITHTVKKGDYLYGIAKKYGVSHHKILREYNQLTSNSLKVGQVLKIPPKEVEEKPKEEEKDTKTITYYQKIDKTYLGSTIFLTAETQNLEGKTITFKVFEKKPTLLKEKDTPVPLLVEEEEKTEVEAKVSEGIAQVKVILQRKGDEAKEDWKEKLSPKEELIEGWYYDSVLDQSVRLLPGDISFILNPERYQPAMVKIPAEMTYLWLEITCKGDQLDFYLPFLKKSGALEVSINTGDHGDYHDPIINPQVRGWYNSQSSTNKDSKILGWNPYASMKYEHKKHKVSDGTPKYEYGRPQRGGHSHSGVDLYAPVGTPIYACVKGEITYHDMIGSKAGYLVQLKGEYKGKTYIFQYLHLMEIKSDKFRFYNNYKNDSKILSDGWINYKDITTPLVDPIVGESYEVSYNGSELKIDNSIININLGAKIKKGDIVKKGDIIGYTGSTGNSYQGKKRNHLHFGIKETSGHRISPYELLKEYINLDKSGVETSSKQDGEIPSGEW